MGCGGAEGPLTSSNVAAILDFTKIQKWHHRLLFMRSSLITIATDAHQYCVKMCVKDMRTATEKGRWR